jgi:hypothetical protein
MPTEVKKMIKDKDNNIPAISILYEINGKTPVKSVH